MKEDIILGAMACATVVTVIVNLMLSDFANRENEDEENE